MTIVLCTQSKTLLAYWQTSLLDTYSDIINITTEIGLQRYLDEKSDVILLLDSNFFTNVKEYLKSLKESYPNTNVLFMDDCPTFRTGKNLLSLGIKGYANSRLSAVHLLQSLTVIANGSVWLYPEFIQQLIKEASFSKESKSDKLESLTCKEKDIAKLVADGYSNKIIAARSKVAESTVKAHLRKIYDKLHVPDRLSLALLIR